MKGKWYFISSIIQLLIGASAIIAFVVLAISGENMSRWIVTLILAVAFIVLGIIGMADNKKQK